MERRVVRLKREEKNNDFLLEYNTKKFSLVSSIMDSLGFSFVDNTGGNKDERIVITFRRKKDVSAKKETSNFGENDSFVKKFFIDKRQKVLQAFERLGFLLNCEPSADNEHVTYYGENDKGNVLTIDFSKN